MAMQLKTLTNKLLNQSTMSFLKRNYSRTLIPSIFWEDPFRHHRSEFWSKPDPFDVLSPIHKYMAYRIPSMNNHWEDERFTSNPKDGFHVSLDLDHFSPNEINVKIVDNSIIVEAKHVKRSENGESYTSRHFTRRYILPDEFDLTKIVSTLSADGILTVRVPSKQIESQNVRNVHIQQTGDLARNPGQIKGPDGNKMPEVNNNEPTKGK